MAQLALDTEKLCQVTNIHSNLYIVTASLEEPIKDDCLSPTPRATRSARTSTSTARVQPSHSPLPILLIILKHLRRSPFFTLFIFHLPHKSPWSESRLVCPYLKR